MHKNDSSFSVAKQHIQHIGPRPEVFRLLRSMHLCGVTAEDNPGA
jgi:hypothetical protein